MSQDKIQFETTPYEFLLVTDQELIEQKFESSIEEFTTYYHQDCLEDLRHHIVRMYVLKVDGKIMGYVTLANAHIRHDAIEPIVAKGINGPVPALLISHLAVHKDHQRRHVGQTMLKEVLGSVVPIITPLTGCRYLMLNPRDDQGVRDFYLDAGFDYYPRMIDQRVTDEETGKTYDKTRDAFLYDLLK